MTSWYVYQPGAAIRATGVPIVPDLDAVKVAVDAGVASQRMSPLARKGP